MNVKDLAKYIDQEITVRFESFFIPCRIKDVKLTYGNVRFLVSPVSGSGQQWIDQNRAILGGAQ